MVYVGIRELRDRFSEYLQRVRRGETVAVNDRGKEIARIMPSPKDADELPDWYNKLVAEGKITDKGRLRVEDLPEPIKMTPGDKTMVDYVREQRR